ncbi:MAG: DUF2341 domain-containing protein [Candidatus Thorarchaeota archaeon]
MKQTWFLMLFVTLSLTLVIPQGLVIELRRTLSEETEVNFTYAAEWLQGYRYRRHHIISGAPTTGENYQIRMIFHYGNLSNYDEHFYCDHQCRIDFNDIRITARDGITVLEHWIQERLEADYAIFWIRVTEAIDESTLIYIYYGNPDATDQSDMDKTFLFSDGFDGPNGALPDPDKWIDDEKGDRVGLDGQGNLVLDGNVDGHRSAMLSRCELGPYNISILSRFQLSSSLDQMTQLPGGMANGFNSSDRIDIYTYTDENCIRMRTVNDNIDSGPTDSYVQDMTQFRIYEMKWFEEDVYCYQDDWEYFHQITSTPDDALNLSLGEGNVFGEHCLIDWIVVRRCIAPEPWHIFYGSLEMTEPILSTSVTSTSSTSSAIQISTSSASSSTTIQTSSVFTTPTSMASPTEGGWSLDEIWMVMSSAIIAGSIIIITVLGILILRYLRSE